MKKFALAALVLIAAAPVHAQQTVILPSLEQMILQSQGEEAAPQGHRDRERDDERAAREEIKAAERKMRADRRAQKDERRAYQREQRRNAGMLARAIRSVNKGPFALPDGKRRNPSRLRTLPPTANRY